MARQSHRALVINLAKVSNIVLLVGSECRLSPLLLILDLIDPDVLCFALLFFRLGDPHCLLDFGQFQPDAEDHFLKPSAKDLFAEMFWLSIVQRIQLVCHCLFICLRVVVLGP